ncbi:MAG: N-6 DNA methylase [Deltaproteobacteria bacterium GWC2_42_51]|nr:MAG: N-6 DNA methylase [Deltaproteobacteria bacterium GWB2_42_7]OGP31629.1 MAG: N-6 DNA methylase [Deltaproteobacteria bacterium GWC2_42_51]OGP43934.1 MAG: N-6 DNA methylase [Deltaproteobacteria bacterium GWD2_42_10]OGP46475.1 MAG: N-6 DNA methylase [Deltaproteobacteria bacterium GWF2_42_12]OGQ35948.1 MAG: N-6 DNA methylase [Deltaproteobacteria bacterium RIFCSPLOWO2_02_FULL_42_39]OGQ75791.1 MAG: N-6 DNA methylase [Deltaproteobacteria bacterium RIFOXYA2_FULL_42_10]HCY18912.1 N-6 DNA methyla
MAFKIKKKKTSNGGNLGFEEKLWQAADKMRGHMDPAEYKHVVLGLIFLKYISDAFEERRSQLESSAKDPSSEYYVKEPEARYGIIEDRDGYLSENIFWVPKDARWSYLQANAKQPTIGKIIDDAMVVIEKENSKLKGVLPKDYARPTLDKHTLGELIDLIATIGLGDAESRSKDILGRVYEYFLGRFASAEGKGGGEFYTPQSVVKILVEMIEPYKGRVYDPCCGSGGMFVQSEKFIEAHGGRKGDISIYGQESNPTTWRLCNMNLAIRGIEGNIGSHHADTFRQDIQKDLKADFILANPPFNVSDWKGELLREDVRWRYGTPPVSNANFAWVQHFIHHLSPNGIAGFVLANGSMSSNQSGEGDIRKNIIEADLVDCMIALPGQLFYTTPIPACLWFLTRNKKNSLPAALRTAQAGKFRDRRCQTLFIDARKMGHLIDRTHRELSDEEITRIANTYHAWRGEKDAAEYKDIPGFCKSATIEEIKAHGYVLTPGRYVGAEDIEEDDEPFNEKMKRLTAKLEEEFAESVKLEALIKRNLREFGVACLCHGRQE